MYYKRKDIKSEADLPKECDRYFTHNIADFMSDEYFNPIDNHTLNDRYKGYDSSIHYWLHNIDWYLLSCDDYVQALEELVEKQKELLDMTYDKNIVWDNTKAMELRQRIEELTKKIKG